MNFISNILAWLLPTSSVDQAVTFLLRAAKLLTEAEAANNRTAQLLDKTISELEDERADALLEAERAKRIAAKLNELIA